MVKKENAEAKDINTDEVKDHQISRKTKQKPPVDKALQQELENLKAGLATSEQKVAEVQDKYLRLSAEFDNYRKRTLKEKSDLLKTAGEETISRILPVLDDFERAISAIQATSDPEAIKSGINLIYTKLKETLTQLGLKEIESMNLDFNTDHHEAITKIPAAQVDLKGKVVDVVQKGYYLNDKILRFAKVVVGE